MPKRLVPATLILEQPLPLPGYSERTSRANDTFAIYRAAPPCCLQSRVSAPRSPYPASAKPPAWAVVFRHLLPLHGLVSVPAHLHNSDTPACHWHWAYKMRDHKRARLPARFCIAVEEGHTCIAYSAFGHPVAQYSFVEPLCPVHIQNRDLKPVDRMCHCCHNLPCLSVPVHCCTPHKVRQLYVPGKLACTGNGQNNKARPEKAGLSIANNI